MVVVMVEMKVGSMVVEKVVQKVRLSVLSSDIERAVTKGKGWDYLKVDY